MLQVFHTYKRSSCSTVRQEVIGDEQKDGVAQDEGHFESRAVDVFRRHEEAEQVQQTQEAAGDQEVHYIDAGLTFKDYLWHKQKEMHCLSAGAMISFV